MTVDEPGDQITTARIDHSFGFQTGKAQNAPSPHTDRGLPNSAAEHIHHPGVIDTQIGGRAARGLSQKKAKIIVRAVPPSLGSP